MPTNYGEEDEESLVECIVPPKRMPRLRARDTEMEVTTPHTLF